jgi:hypothetical protein
VREIFMLAAGYLARIDVALEKVTPAPVVTPMNASPRELRAFGLEYLRQFSSKTLRQDIVEARGAQSACVLATKLDSDLITLGKQRPVVQGRDNGNGVAHAG